MLDTGYRVRYQKSHKYSDENLGFIYSTALKSKNPGHSHHPYLVIWY